jgi:hypothetical protein
LIYRLYAIGITPFEIFFLVANFVTDQKIFKDHKVDWKDHGQDPDKLWRVPFLTIDIQAFFLHNMESNYGSLKKYAAFEINTLIRPWNKCT